MVNATRLQAQHHLRAGGGFSGSLQDAIHVDLAVFQWDFSIGRKSVLLPALLLHNQQIREAFFILNKKW